MSLSRPPKPERALSFTIRKTDGRTYKVTIRLSKERIVATCDQFPGVELEVERPFDVTVITGKIRAWLDGLVGGP